MDRYRQTDGQMDGQKKYNGKINHFTSNTNFSGTKVYNRRSDHLNVYITCRGSLLER